ncbi:MAG: hypothetical protein IPK60_00990 [Sandaracinaceae bacterium]|nr:hypothetical protein [Sandaracinaceae bacterium]
MRRLLALAICLWTLLDAPVFAQPMIHVRSESRIELSVRRVTGGIAIEAVLRDDLGTPLADRDVVVRLSPRAHDAIPSSARRRSDATGKVRAEFALPTGDYEIGAQFAGDDDHDRAEVARPLDLTRADVRLRMAVPNEGRFSREDPNPVQVEVLAESVEGGFGLNVHLSDELGRPLATSMTDARGSAHFRMLVTELGPASAGRLIARSDADTRRAEAQTEVPILRSTTTSVTMHTSTNTARPGDTVRVSGELRDSHRDPLPRAAIGIFSGERHVASALTDERGRYDVPLTLEGVEDDVTVVARYDSDAPWRVSSASAPRTITVRTLSFVPFAWALLTTLITGLLVWWVARRSPAPLRAEQSAVVAKSAGIERGARVGARVDRMEVVGVVLDTHDLPIAAAMIELRRVHRDTIQIATDTQGVFSSGTLEPDDYTLVALANGFASLVVHIVVPHRGEWSQIRIRLLNLRKKALDAIHPVAAEVLPKGTWGVTTPREVLDAANAKGPLPDALAELAAKAELAGYAQDPPNEAFVEEVEKARDATLEEFRARKPRADPE